MTGPAAGATFPAVKASDRLRVSDEQRERAASELREHFAAGRLTQEELDERSQLAYAARTEDQLQALMVDLRRLLQETGGGITLPAICVGVWIANGAHGDFWPGWVALVVLIPLLRNLWRLYGPAPQLERVERELERRERGGKRGKRGDGRKRRHGNR